MNLNKPTFITVFALLLFWGPKCHSQVILSLLFGDKLNSEESIFGIHVDYSFNELSGYADTNSLNSLNLGLFYNYKFNDRFRGLVELMAKYKRGVEGLAVYDLQDPELNDLFEDGEVTRKIKYFSVLPIGQYVTKPGIFLEAGPQISMRIKATDIFFTKTEQGDLELERNIKDNITTFDFGFIAGIGYYVDKAKTLAVGFRYQGGFSDVVKDDGTQQHQQFTLYTNIPIGRNKSKQTAAEHL